MTTNILTTPKLRPWLTIAAIVLLSAYLLHTQGRLWICACGQVWLWSGNIWSSDNSQHLADPYSFTHILHGFAFFWLLVWAWPRLALEWRLVLALFIEAAWEVVENSAFVINRYRETTLAQGYTGDTIVNSLGDIACCALGFWLARQLGFRRTLALFVLTELVLLLWIKDSLILNVIMLLYPIDAIKVWQIGQ